MTFVCWILYSSHQLHVCMEIKEENEILKENITGYRKNHWTKDRLVCTHLFKLIPNYGQQIKQFWIFSNFSEKKKNNNDLSAPDFPVEQVHYCVVGALKDQNLPHPFLSIIKISSENLDYLFSDKYDLRTIIREDTVYFPQCISSKWSCGAIVMKHRHTFIKRTYPNLAFKMDVSSRIFYT